MNSDSGEPAAGGQATEERAGTIMRRARDAKGLSLAEVATRTRVPLRHLQAIEDGDYGALPGLTYCAGFARAYARAVGLDEVSLVAKVRGEVDATGEFTSPYEVDEPADPARIPPRALAWAAAIVAILIIGGYALWRMQTNAVPEQDFATQETPAPVTVAERRPAPQTAVPTSGPVVLTAVDDVWLRIYDADGKDLLERTMKRGESFTVPADANGPMILTGRADALAVTVGGHPVPPLGSAERTVADLPISAAALLARPPQPAEGAARDAAGTQAPPPAGQAAPRAAASPTRQTAPRPNATPARRSEASRSQVAAPQPQPTPASQPHSPPPQQQPDPAAAGPAPSPAPGN